MIIRQNEMPRSVNERMRGGDGSVVVESVVDKEKLYGKGRLFARILLKPGCSIGYHTHEGEMETFYILKGAVSYNDDGETVTLQAGDAAYTPDGGGHSVANDGREDAELMALIVYK